jgi:hypothetical protein
MFFNQKLPVVKGSATEFLSFLLKKFRKNVHSNSPKLRRKGESL